MASRRAFTSTALRAAAQSLVTRPARPVFAAVSKTQLLRPAVVGNATRSLGARRWLNTDEYVLDSKTWNFEDVKKHLEAQEGKDNVVIVGMFTSYNGITSEGSINVAN